MKSRRVNPSEYLPTAADYIARAACPFLIMVLVGCLAFFIQKATYSGPHEFRLKWLIFWCVPAMVGISRIAIEKTPAYAGLYALALGLAGYVFVSRYFEMPLIGWLILAVIWWCTNKLVYDCTLIEDKDDASGEGLLGIAGMDETNADEERDARAAKPAAKQKISIWKRLLTNARSKTDRPHAPGLWVLYFSIAALPIFGFGQLLMARLGDSRAGMLLVVIYLVTAVALLLLTSFLGLRRYLRQRRLKMPGAMASRWIATGAGILLVVLFVSLVLPRPLSSASPNGREAMLHGKVLEDDRYVDGGKSEEGEVDGESDETKSGEEERDQGEGERQGPVDESQSSEGKRGEGESEESSPGSSGSMPNFLNSPLVRWILWGIFAIAVLIFAWKHRAEIAQAMRDLWESLKNLFNRKPKPKKKKPGKDAQVDEVPTIPSRVFAALENPFSTNDASLSPEVVVTRTFDALEVWAGEQGCPRDRQMTANEFARELTYRYPDARSEINRLIALHSGSIYADRSPKPEELPPLAKLWNYMQANAGGACQPAQSKLN